MMECYLHESESATVESRMHRTWSHDRSWVIDYTQMRRMSSKNGRHHWNETHVQ